MWKGHVQPPMCEVDEEVGKRWLLGGTEIEIFQIYV
jgi:hypothetical protein